MKSWKMTVRHQLWMSCLQMANLTLCSLGNSSPNYECQIRLHGFYKRRKLSILIDIGSSSNFIDERLAKGLNCTLIKIAL